MTTNRSLVMFAVVLAIGCGGGGAGISEIVEEGGNVTLTLTPSGTSITTSRTVSLSAKVEGSTEKHVTYACNSGQIILDDGLGQATWKAGPVSGEALIRATSVANKNVSSSVKVQVQDLSLHEPLTTDFSMADVGDEVALYSNHTFSGARRVVVGEPMVGNVVGFVEATIVDTYASNTRFLVPNGIPSGWKIPIRLFDGDTEVGMIGMRIDATPVFVESEYNDVIDFSDNPLDLYDIRGDSDSHFHSTSDVDYYVFKRHYQDLTAANLNIQPVRFEVTVEGAGDATIDGITLDAQRKGVFTWPTLWRYGQGAGWASFMTLVVRGTGGPYEIRLRGLLNQD